MKKHILVLVLVCISIAGISPAYAHRYPAYRYSGYPFGVGLAAGIITGAIVADLFFPHPARVVIVSPPPPVVVQPAPIIIQRPYSAAYPPMAVGNSVSVTAQILNVRSGPGMNFAVIGRVYQGNMLLTIGNAPQWVYVQLPDGNFGWVMAEFTAQTSSPASG